MQSYTIAHFSRVIQGRNCVDTDAVCVLVIPGLPAQGEVQHRMLTDLNTDASPLFPTFASGLKYILSSP